LNEFAAGRWLEVTDDYHDLHEKPGTLVRILKVENNILFIEPSTKIGADDITAGNFPETYHPKVRLWDSIGEVTVEIPVLNDGFIPLEDGVEVKFIAGDYQTGDYWLIPARNATADIEWPQDETDPTKPVFKNPNGIKHHYAQLALVEFTAEVFNLKQDCRDTFPPLNEVTIGKGCCTITVGDGKTSFGDMDSIQAAVDKLLQGGRICILPGFHNANVVIENGRNIIISGCGKQTIVIPPGETENNLVQPLFLLKNSEHIILENMDMIHSEGTAVQVDKSAFAGLRQIEISGNRIIALKHAVRVDDEDGEKINITNNSIRMIDKEDGDVAIYIGAKNSQIENNDIMVVPSTQIIERGMSSDTSLFWYWFYILNQYPSPGFNAPGGIQVAGGSEGITIKGNDIRGGFWNGITLGHIPSSTIFKVDYNLLAKTHYGINKKVLGDNLEEFKNSFLGIITGVEIIDNEIKYMGLNGIGVVNIFSLTEVAEMVSVDGLTITGNMITACLQQLPREIEENMKTEMAFAGIALSDTENLIIRENRIEENGTSFTAPVCGIFIRHGERIDIADNHILNNGPTQKETLDKAATGIGGGVVIAMSMGKMMADLKAGLIPYVDGFPAVKIHDNIITQPMGKALYIVAMGPISIVGNHLVSRGIHPRILFYPYLAGSVMIMNLGVSRDLFARMLISNFRTIAWNMGSSNFKTNMTTINVFTGAGSFSYNINRISPGIFSPCRNCDPADPTTTPPGGTTFPTVPPKTGPTQEILLYLPGGNILFANNRITMDLRSPERNFIISSQFIASLDDISYGGNQSECNTFFDLVQTDVFTIGNTVRTNDNRFQEGLTLTLYSLLSIGLMMNTWTGNQASHCLIAVGILKEAKGNNLVLYKGLFFDLTQITDKKSYCELSREMLFSKLKPGQVSTLPPDGSD
ncbi:MAG TPA: right-handed parallel beta-helix repeat-containing protein, partial [Candidatus Deferrimicrobium sp.]|nr:right-handed parallel beta-helix repeat-containing protein [Candidatus Deferrimicrobium sp.]